MMNMYKKRIMHTLFVLGIVTSGFVCASDDELFAEAYEFEKVATQAGMSFAQQQVGPTIALLTARLKALVGERASLRLQTAASEQHEAELALLTAQNKTLKEQADAVSGLFHRAEASVPSSSSSSSVASDDHEESLLAEDASVQISRWYCSPCGRKFNCEKSLSMHRRSEHAAAVSSPLAALSSPAVSVEAAVFGIDRAAVGDDLIDGFSKRAFAKRADRPSASAVNTNRQKRRYTQRSSDGYLHCESCPAKYLNSTGLYSHRQSKHKDVVELAREAQDEHSDTEDDNG